MVSTEWENIVKVGAELGDTALVGAAGGRAQSWWVQSRVSLLLSPFLCMELWKSPRRG